MSYKVSVVTAVFNDETFIEKSVQSILNQTLTDLEYIVVDDGSTDGTLNILKSLAMRDHRLKVLVQANEGAAAARNRAIFASSGHFIAIQDSDDIAQPHRLELQVNHLLSLDEKAISCSGYAVINMQDKVITHNNKVYRDITGNILRGSFGAMHPTMMVYRSAIVAIDGYNKFYNKTEDFDLVLRLLENGGYVRKINECLISYRIRGNSESSLNNGGFKTRAFVNHLLRMKGLPEDFSSVVNEVSNDKYYIVKREAREIFFSENYRKFLSVYLRNIRRLPQREYFPYFVFSLLPGRLRAFIKKKAG